MFAGNTLPDGAEPLAQAYAGHQFGGFSPQLGDGRALASRRGDRPAWTPSRHRLQGLGPHAVRPRRRRQGGGRAHAARGAGRRGDARARHPHDARARGRGDGRAGLPRTSVARRGADARGSEPHPGRDLRVFCLARRCANACANWPSTRSRGTIPDSLAAPQPFLALLENVAERQSALIAQWMNVGFIHGVMNTDNMAISGETIDYGPCAFMEAYDPAAVFSSIDHGGRYAFGNQPDIACWNLARLAETLLPLLSDDTEQAVALATEVIAAFPAQYRRHLLRGQRAKLGLRRGEPDDDSADAALAEDWLSSASRRAGGFHPRMAPAGRRRDRRRSAAARAVHRRARARRMAGALAGSLRQRGRQRSGWHGNSTRQSDAQRQSDRHRPQPPRGRGAGRRVGRGRSRALRSVARCAQAAVRRGGRVWRLTPSRRQRM